MPLAGFGNSTQRISQAILDLQYATCIAITDENENTVLMIALNQQRSSDITVNTVRPLITEATGIPAERIMISASHTHSGPDMNAVSNEAIQRYIPYLNAQIVQAAVDALADRTPVTAMEAGSNQGQIYEGIIMDGCQIIDVTGIGSFDGEFSDLRVGDTIHSMKNYYGKPGLVFITGRALPDKEFYCDHCSQTVAFTGWDGGSNLTASGHYYL